MSIPMFKPAVIIFAAVLLTTAAAARADAGEVKIAVVDLRRALNETNEGKAAMKKLTKHKDKLQAKVEKKEKRSSR